MTKENWIKSKLWRAIIVIYFFLTIPFFLIIRWFGAIEEKSILWAILIPLIYIILTDILRWAVYYIDSWKYQLAIRNKIKSLF